jgi:hypothetical protein
MAEEATKGDATATTSSGADGLFFRRDYVAPQMCMPPDQQVRFESVGPLAASVEFQPLASEARRWWGSPSLRCTVTARSSLPRRALALFKALWCGDMPDGIPAEDLLLHPEPWMRSTGPLEPVFRDRCVPPFLHEALRPIESQLEEAAAGVAGLVRWRCNRTGPVDLPRISDLAWSMDGASWRLDVRRPVIPVAEFGPDLVVTDARRSDLEKMLAEGQREPLHQSLFREAGSLRETNPRSALVIGVTAAEVAVKTLVAQLAPQTSWIVQNMPSPPIAKILEEYVPTLLPQGAPPFAAESIKALKAAVTLRNELVHGARDAVDAGRLSSAFRVLGDVVWLCDYHCGAPWAVNRVDKATRDAMGLAATVDTSGWFVD